MASTDRVTTAASAGGTMRPKRHASLLRMLGLAIVALSGFTLTYYLSRPRPAPTVGKGEERPEIKISEDRALAESPEGERSKQLKNLPPLDALPPESTQALIDEAERVAENLTASSPQNPDAHEAVARFYFWLGSTQKAEAGWKRCLELNPEYAHALQGLASAAFRRGEYDQSVNYLRKTLLITPDSQKAQTELGKALVAVGKPAEAVEMLQRTVQAPTVMTEAWIELGGALLQLKEYARAKDAYQQAIKQDPDYARAYFGLATACARLGEKDQAKAFQAQFRKLRAQERQTLHSQRTEYNDLQALQEDVSDFYAEMGRVYLAEGRLLAAEYLWRRAASINPQHRDARQALAWLYRQQQQPLRTVRMMRQLAKIEPENSSYLMEAARMLVQLGRLDLAERTLRQLTDRIPDHPAPHAALAELYLEHIQQPEKAAEHAQKAVDLAPQAGHFSLLSAVLKATGKHEQALQAIKSASEKAPENLRYRQMYELMKEELNRPQ